MSEKSGLRVENHEFTSMLESQRFDEDAYTRLHLRELFPYDDDEYLKKRLITARPRVLRKNETLREIVELCLAETDDESLLDTADMVGSEDDWFERSPTHVGKIIDFLNYCCEIDMIQSQAQGGDTSAERMNYLGSRRADDLLRSVTPEQFEDFYMSAFYVAFRLSDLAEKTRSEAYVNLQVKLTRVVNSVSVANRNLHYLETRPSADSKTYTPEEIAEDTMRVADLFAESKASRTHGMQLGYIEAAQGGSLVFSDLQADMRQLESGDLPNVHRLALKVPLMAQVTHSSQSRPRYIKPRYSVDDKKGLGTISTNNLRPHELYFLGPDGELYSDLTCVLPMAGLAAMSGRYELYRATQAEIVANFHDLTHGQMSVKKSTHVPSANSSHKEKGENALDSLTRLMIPRLKNSASSEATSDQQYKKELKIHGVVWHRRQLPEGWRPSPEALGLADAAGVKLEEGETFVRAHRRGSKELGEVVGHKLVKRA